MAVSEYVIVCSYGIVHNQQLIIENFQVRPVVLGYQAVKRFFCFLQLFLPRRNIQLGFVFRGIQHRIWKLTAFVLQFFNPRRKDFRRLAFQIASSKFRHNHVAVIVGITGRIKGGSAPYFIAAYLPIVMLALQQRCNSPQLFGIHTVYMVIVFQAVP